LVYGIQREQHRPHHPSRNHHRILTLDAGQPANIDAEKTILGAILLDNAAYSEAAERIDADDFSLDSHRRIFLRMTELLNAQRAVDIVTLANELAALVDKKLAEINDSATL